MRACPCSPLLGLLIFLFPQSCVEGQRSCCFSFSTSPIPVALITEYKITPPGCSNLGVIFTIPKGPVCVDPSSRWVKRAMDIIDRRTKDQTSRKETKAKPPPTPKTKRTIEQDGNETEGRTRSMAETMRTDPAVDQDGYTTKGRPRSTPETRRTDSAEPNWFCHTEL